MGKRLAITAITVVIFCIVVIAIVLTATAHRHVSPVVGGLLVAVPCVVFAIAFSLWMGVRTRRERVREDGTKKRPHGED